MLHTFDSTRLRQTGQISLLLLVLLVGTLNTNAQVTTGTVRGQVKDPQGAVVPGAKISATNKSTGVTQVTQSAGGGEFELINLLPGDYTMTVEAANFKTL